MWIVESMMAHNALATREIIACSAAALLSIAKSNSKTGIFIVNRVRHSRVSFTKLHCVCVSYSMSKRRVVFPERFKFLEKSMKEEFLGEIRLVYVFGHRSNECNIFIITNEDKVYGFGYNTRGVLGFGHDKNIKLLTQNKELSNKKIINLKDGFYHVMALTKDGEVYCWGRNACGGLGNGKRE